MHPWSAQNAVVFHRFTGLNRHSLRSGFTAYFVLSPVTALYCHRRQRDAKHHRQLDASFGASGPHDFAVRNDAVRPAQKARATSFRPPHPAPTFLTMANVPLPGQDVL
jgi:hypothetical protein